MTQAKSSPGSLQIGTVMGIPILVHYSFLLILPFLVWAIGNNIKALASYAQVPVSRLALSPYMLGLLIVIGLFASVVLHELGHSYVALRKGVGIRSITLMLFGGVAQLEEMPSGPLEEAKMALAGPAVSFVLGFCCNALGLMVPRAENSDLAFALSYLGHMNLFLGAFNLLPAFPMDGGRVLRSVLARWTPFLTATTVAANVGKVLAFALGVLGVFRGDLFLVLIAFFVYIGATQEHEFTVIKSTLDGLRVRDMMTSPVVTVGPEMTVPDLIDKMFRERHTGYPVVQGEVLVGCVTQEDIEKREPDRRSAATVADIMSKEVMGIGPQEDAHVALNKMSDAEIGRLPVIDGEKLVGIVSRTDILRGFKLRQLQKT